MTLHKMVNGVPVDMSPEEEAEILAEWAANDPATQPPPPKSPLAMCIDYIAAQPDAPVELKAMAAGNASAAAAKVSP